MSHVPTRLDVATDLRRSIYATFSPNGFSDKNFSQFFSHAITCLDYLRRKIDQSTLQLIEKQLEKAKDDKLSLQNRREDLLTAAMLLQG